MQLATWLSVIALGPGAIAIFAWFLWDLKRISQDETKRD